MLSLQPPPKSSHPHETTPNFLPFRTAHTGPVSASKRYWNPETNADGTKTAYFHGRRLLGRDVKVPESHRGVLVRATGRTKTNARQNQHALSRSIEGDGDEDEDEAEGEHEGEQAEVGIMEEVGRFDKVVVWGHDAIPASDEEFVRGMSEWAGFAEGIHSYEKGSGQN